MAKEKVQQPYRMTPITAIRPYDRNPRIIPQAAVDAVARSIQAFGFRSPIIVDRDGVILAGHTRYKAAQQLGLAEVPVVWQTDITDIQARGYRIADNKVAELSAWDRDALDLEVRELADLGDTDLDALGLADWELERILADDSGGAGLPEEAPPGSYSQTRPTTLDAVQTAPLHADDRVALSREVLLRVVFPDREKLDAASPEVAEAAEKFGGSVLAD